MMSAERDGNEACTRASWAFKLVRIESVEGGGDGGEAESVVEGVDLAECPERKRVFDTASQHSSQ